MSSMKAVRIHEYGGPEVLKYEDTPRPESGDGDVLVRVMASGVNPVDWKIRQGLRKDALPYVLPMIPGWDLSGVVESVGPGVTGFAPGDQVFSRPDLKRNGSYAEFIAVRADPSITFWSSTPSLTEPTTFTSLSTGNCEMLNSRIKESARSTVSS